MMPLPHCPILDCPHAERTGVVGTHLAATAHHVGEHDRGQLAGLGWCRTTGVFTHGSDYAVRLAWLSNGASNAVGAV